MWRRKAESVSSRCFKADWDLLCTFLKWLKVRRYLPVALTLLQLLRLHDFLIRISLVAASNEEAHSPQDLGNARLSREQARECRAALGRKVTRRSGVEGLTTRVLDGFESRVPHRSARQTRETKIYSPLWFRSQAGRAAIKGKFSLPAMEMLNQKT